MFTNMPEFTTRTAHIATTGTVRTLHIAAKRALGLDHLSATRELAQRRNMWHNPVAIAFLESKRVRNEHVLM